MKKSFTGIVFLFLIAGIFAQTPQKMSYQAMLRNSNNQLITNKTVGMRISILHGSISGTTVYTEIQTPNTNANGLITIEIGGGTGFDTITWANGPYFIKTETDPEGGTDYTITGTSQLLSVPYALYANSFSGDMSDNRIINLSDPVNSHDAVNKQYVDDLIQKMHILYYGITDTENNHYNVVQIGNQIWMAENLKSTKYYDGTDIPLVTDNSEWGNLATPGYCWYNNLGEFGDVYGGLYNWYTIETEKICPAGWHVPGDEEWTQLTDYLEGISEAGGKLKETGIAHWNSPNTGATNESDFTALPGGGRYDNGAFGSIGIGGNWWSSSEYPTLNAWSRDITYDNSSVYRKHSNKKLGFSVRCVRD